MFSRVTIIFITVVLLTAAASTAIAADKKLTVGEAAVLLQQLGPDVEVISVGPAPVEGLWEVVVKFRGYNKIIYMDSAGKHIIEGSIINLAAKVNLTKLKLDEINVVDFSRIPLGDALVMGKKEARHRVVVFDDPD
jgi:thiol:disulfide interchange protein DsbC